MTEINNEGTQEMLKIGIGRPAAEQMSLGADPEVWMIKDGWEAVETVPGRPCDRAGHHACDSIIWVKAGVGKVQTTGTCCGLEVPEAWPVVED